MISQPKSQKGLQNDQKSIRFIDKTHMASHHVGKPYKTCRIQLFPSTLDCPRCAGALENDTIIFFNDTITNDTIKNDTITNDTVKNDTIIFENDTIINDTIKMQGNVRTKLGS